MDKDNTVYVHDGISGNLKNERKPVTCYNTVYNVKDIIRSQKTNIVLSHSFEIPKVVKITDTGKKKRWIPRAEGEIKEFSEYGVSVLQNEKVPEICCTTMLQEVKVSVMSFFTTIKSDKRSINMKMCPCYVIK